MVRTRFVCLAVGIWLCLMVLSASSGSAQDVDYFPDKITVDYATGFDVVYHTNYKVVTVRKPWRDAESNFEYVLVQSGTQMPKGFEPWQVFEVPVSNFVALSTVYLPHVDVLGLHPDLVGVSAFKYIYSPQIRGMVQKRSLKELGYGASVDLELLVDLDPGLVMASGMGNPGHDIHPRLMEMGIPIVLNGDYVETHPLGRAEWLKFTALFFNKETEAQHFFDDVASEYHRLAQLGRSAKGRPTVFSANSWNGTWHMPGGKSYIAQFLADAGAEYLWADNDRTVSLPLDFEVVLERAKDADFWINTGTWESVGDARAADERHLLFGALNAGRTFNRNARLHENGGNDFWESATIRPHKVLADLIKVFHPALLPDHQLIWYRQLTP